MFAFLTIRVINNKRNTDKLDVKLVEQYFAVERRRPI